MKKTLVCLTSMICLLAAFAYAADKTATETNQGVVLKTTNVKTAKMNARGKVVEISDKAIKIARSIKGDIEIMEFALENPLEGIAVNDSVKIDYSVKSLIYCLFKSPRMRAFFIISFNNNLKYLRKNITH